MNGKWIRKTQCHSAAIFVHGILSDGDACWRNENGTYWPDLLKDEEDLKDLGIYVYTYQTNIFSGTYRLGDVVDDLKERMRYGGLFNKKTLVFVCHSMGGIIVRKLIVERIVDFIDKRIDVGLFLVASPSLGSAYATWISPLATMLGHTQAEALRFTQSNSWLNDLDKEFQNMKEASCFKLRGKELVEDKFVILGKLWRKQVVEPFSGARYFGEQQKIPGSDHFSISKPKDTDAIQHQALCYFVRELLNPITVSSEQFSKITLDSTRSTNDEAVRLLLLGERVPFLVHAWNQTHGRGKADRTWQGGSGILTATWAYAFSNERTRPQDLSPIGLVVALAVKDAVESVNPGAGKVEVKWPNDVLLSQKKVAGILIEVRQTESENVCIIGVGVNVCRTPVLSDAKRYFLPPTSIFPDYQNDKEKEDRILKTLTTITSRLSERLTRFLSENGLGTQKGEWQIADYCFDKEVEIKTPQSAEIVVGIHKGVNEAGQLILELPGGRQIEYFSAEVSTLKGAFDVDGVQNELSEQFHRRVKLSDGQTVEEIRSPIEGHIISIPEGIQVGTSLTKGRVLCTLESGKMGFSVQCPVDGKIVGVSCTVGSVVKESDLLFTVAIDSPRAKRTKQNKRRRFRVALSFPGEHRDFVQRIALSLAERLGKNVVFYDKFFEAELARPNLDIYLQEIYHDHSDLIAVFICSDYEHKEWCGIEWRALRDLLKRKEASAIMPFRFDNTRIDGLFSIDGYISINGRSPEDIAALILVRLEMKAPSLKARVRKSSGGKGISPELVSEMKGVHTPTRILRAVEQVLLHPDYPTFMSENGVLVSNPVWSRRTIQELDEQRKMYRPEGPTFPRVMRGDLLLILRKDNELLTYPSRWKTHLVHYRPWQREDDPAKRHQANAEKFAPKWGVPVETIQLIPTGKFIVSLKINEETKGLWLYIFELFHLRCTQWSERLRQVQRDGYTESIEPEKRNKWVNLDRMRDDDFMMKVNGDIVSAIHHLFNHNLSILQSSFPGEAH
jgi:biotin-[acetyl-CoA-carboxylase] ligase BirA-like protein